jgi:inner membrane protein
VAFVLAYGVASGACISLLAFYVSFVLKSFWRGLGFASLMTVLFGVLYALLQAEDYALLMGSLLLFGVLAIVMILTRRLDWFAIGDAPAASAPGMPAR